MEEQTNKNTKYDIILTASDTPNSSKSKLIWITLSIIAFISLTITLYFIFNNSSANNSEDTPKEISIEIGKPLKDCLKMNEFNLNCNLLFSIPDIEERCEELKNLKDECFYKIANIYARLDLCWKIESNDLEKDCEIEINNLVIDIPIYDETPLLE